MRTDARIAGSAAIGTENQKSTTTNGPPGHEIEDLLFSRLDENKLGDYLGPEVSPTYKQ
jgi:hypothetical protein